MSLISELSHVFCKLPSLVLISQQCQCFWKFHLYILIALLRGLFVTEKLIQNLHTFLEIYKNKIMRHKCVTASVIMYPISVKNVACNLRMKQLVTLSTWIYYNSFNTKNLTKSFLLRIIAFVFQDETGRNSNIFN